MPGINLAESGVENTDQVSHFRGNSLKNEYAIRANVYYCLNMRLVRSLDSIIKASGATVRPDLESLFAGFQVLEDSSRKIENEPQVCVSYVPETDPQAMKCSICKMIIGLTAKKVFGATATRWIRENVPGSNVTCHGMVHVRCVRGKVWAFHKETENYCRVCGGSTEGMRQAARLVSAEAVRMCLQEAGEWVDDSIRGVYHKRCAKKKYGAEPGKEVLRALATKEGNPFVGEWLKNKSIPIEFVELGRLDESMIEYVETWSSDPSVACEIVLL